MVDFDFVLIVRSTVKSDQFLKNFPSYYVPRISSYCIAYRQDLITKQENIRDADLEAVLILIDLLPVPNGFMSCENKKKTAKTSKSSKQCKKNMDATKNLDMVNQNKTNKKISKHFNIYKDLIEHVSNKSQMGNFMKSKIVSSSQTIQPYIICVQEEAYFVVTDRIALSRADT
ncbi:hypothetical protein QAD02_007855 [Eretmocerus hayati]|uniref:Uncharacterized protein n=1 Tax=Eretmocerus hayati TaxID=131215 RepID=A0ACC2N5G8_9HYME|nr:hypothetical protein QAD02_007855 [Eretmocerus hayati]